ncbi:MAG: sigma-70 family RNA polymerase sigma factor [Firmicutes bacterium]|nr:sigma-70 family RNA polymerase sigma factor [Bacillota bacterium]
MSQENYILSVYNAITGQTENIEVNEAVYKEYRRGNWSIDNSDRRFHNHETPFTELKGGLDSAYENFDEFRSDQDNPERLAIEKLTRQELQQAWSRLADGERELLQALFIEGKSERQTAVALGLPYMTVHSRKIRLLHKLKNFLCF